MDGLAQMSKYGQYSEPNHIMKTTGINSIKMQSDFFSALCEKSLNFEGSTGTNNC